MSIRRDRALALYGRACGWKGKGGLAVCRVNRIGESRAMRQEKELLVGRKYCRLCAACDCVAMGDKLL